MTGLIATPVGALGLDGAEALTAVHFGRAGDLRDGKLFAAAAEQLQGYFAGTRRDFDLPLDLGSGFRADFLRALLAIPYGETRTYGDLARALGVPAQAIGRACGANRLPVIVPCHRVLGASGLGGYSGAGGVETKVALLRLEGAGGLLI